MKKLEKAMAFAKEKHAGQKRWDGGDYYTNHCLVVMEYVKGHIQELITNPDHSYWFNDPDTFENLLCAAILHDSIEDTDTEPQDILNNFGSDIEYIVSYLTKQPNEKYSYYIKRMINCYDSYFYPAIKSIKLADLRCNMSDLKKGAMLDKYELAEYILLNHE